ncbi:MAG: endonuclease III [Actinobacteria bacterium]|nr:endonuclease III [Actinomycetota bacterium]
MKDSKKNINLVLDILEQYHPEARVLLEHKNAFQLLIATILAAQCTDEMVNKVTKVLFEKYRTPRDFAEANMSEFEEIIKPTGFYRNKAKSVVACCQALLLRFDGEVPDNIDDLLSLSGVGRKTANIVLANCFGKQAIAVDTHVSRVSQRIGLATSKDPDKIEFQLNEIIPRKRWSRATQLIGFHGRKVCHAKKPDCINCPINEFCKTGQEILSGIDLMNKK